MLTISRILITSLAVSCFLVTGPVLAKTSDELKALQEEVKVLQDGQVKMQKDLEEIKKLLREAPRAAAAPTQKAFAPTDMVLGNVPVKGESNAPVTLVEFSDYQCPYCKRHALSVMPALIKNYVDTGKLRFVMREYPITRLHARAVPASEAALCAHDQGQYWDMHDALFNDQKANSDADFQKMAADMGLDVAAFTACMDTDKFADQIKADIAEGQKVGISGTPSFVLGLTDPDDPSKVHLTKFIRGAQGLPAFSAAIDELLKTATLAK